MNGRACQIKLQLLQSREGIRQAAHYFTKLPFFSLQLYIKEFDSLEAVTKICPVGPKTESYSNALTNICKTHAFLHNYYPEQLSALYNTIATIREADVFTYPFLNRNTLSAWNAFDNLDILSQAYEEGPVLILYAHSGSYYQTMAATGVLGYKIYPFTYWVDPSEIKRPSGWLYLMNIKLSERCFSGGHYLYTESHGLVTSLKKIIEGHEKAIIYSAIDLPISSKPQERVEVAFLDGRSAFQCKTIKMFTKLNFPIVIAFSSVRIIKRKVKRFLHFERIPACLSTAEVLQLYSLRLSDFIRKNPEQLLNLINIDDLYL